MKYNIYCDESCHLPNDHSPVMVLGAAYCPADKKQQIFSDIRAIKTKHGIDSHMEIKWTKVSKSKIDFYLDLLDYFWRTRDLHYRCLVAEGKNELDHQKYNCGDFDLWYYKMYFRLLDPIIDLDAEYRIFIDIKDTKGGKRIKKLHEVLCNNMYDFNKEVITDISLINSKESEILQMGDLLNGAIAFYHRGLYKNIMANVGKTLFIDALQKRVNLDIATARSASKFNLFIWTPQR